MPSDYQARTDAVTSDNLPRLNDVLGSDADSPMNDDRLFCCLRAPMRPC